MRARFAGHGIRCYFPAHTDCALDVALEVPADGVVEVQEWQDEAEDGQNIAGRRGVTVAGVPLKQSQEALTKLLLSVVASQSGQAIFFQKGLRPHTLGHTIVLRCTRLFFHQHHHLLLEWAEKAPAAACRGQAIRD